MFAMEFEISGPHAASPVRTMLMSEQHDVLFVQLLEAEDAGREGPHMALITWGSSHNRSTSGTPAKATPCSASASTRVPTTISRCLNVGRQGRCVSMLLPFSIHRRSREAAPVFASTRMPSRS